MVLQINVLNILEPNCKLTKPRKIEGRRSLTDFDPVDIPLTELKNGSAYWCREYNDALSGIWANDRRVRDALQVRENTTGVLKRCNATLAYTKNVLSSVPFHQNLTKTSLWAHIYRYTEKFTGSSGDFTLIYATGAGHIAPEYKPKECYQTIDRFFAYLPL
ncbi:hypothetical protein QYF36_004811 [Acer negundo]|nr:hypothetical protein QYF36_004811 [Acer negundo]